MERFAKKGSFYPFHRSKREAEYGKEMACELAVTVLRHGRDLYTPNREDAYRLALSAFTRHPIEHRPHAPTYFCHFQELDAQHEYDKRIPNWERTKGGVSGHVFFDFRGESFVPPQPDPPEEPKHKHNVQRHG